MNNEVAVTIEIPYGSMLKYELNKETGQLFVDRPLPYPLPYNYGFVNNTLHGDGDPLDICVINQTPIHPTATLTAVVVGAFRCIDNGEQDDKLVGYIKGSHMDPYTVEVAKEEIRKYLSTYKKGFQIIEFVEIAAAMEIVRNDTCQS